MAGERDGLGAGCVLCGEPFDAPEDLNTLTAIEQLRPLRHAGGWAHATCREQAPGQE